MILINNWLYPELHVFKFATAQVLVQKLKVKMTSAIYTKSSCRDDRISKDLLQYADEWTMENFSAMCVKMVNSSIDDGLDCSGEAEGDRNFRMITCRTGYTELVTCNKNVSKYEIYMINRFTTIFE